MKRLGMTLLLLVCACSRGPDPAARPGQQPGLVRLWRDLEPIDVATREPTPARGELCLEARLDGTQQVHWLRELGDGSLGYAATQPAAGPLVVAANVGRAAVLSAPVAGGSPVSIHIRVRSEATGSAPVLLALERDQPFDPAATLSAPQVASLLDPFHSAHHLLRAEWGTEANELELQFVTDPSIIALELYLLGPRDAATPAAVFESFEVRTLRLADYVARGAPVRRMERLAGSPRPEVVAVTLDRERREALLAVAPSRFAWQLPASSSGRRLELSLGVMPRAARPGGSLRLRVLADGVELLAESRWAPTGLEQPAWQDLQVDLPSAAHQLVLAVDPVADDPPLSLLGHPTVCSLAEDSRPNVVLISLDTLRADRLGCYGAPAGTSPNLDALAAQGQRFSQLHSTSSYTLPSHGSMLSGVYPAFHGALDVGDTLDPRRAPALAELLAEAGWQTAAFTGGGFVSTDFGFGRGFDRYSENDPAQPIDTRRGQVLLENMSWQRMPVRAELIERYGAAAIGSWIERHREGPPFFLFLHTYVTHNYAPSKRWLRRRGLLGRPGDPDYEEPFMGRDRARFNAGEHSLRQAVYDREMPYYDATVGTADDFVGSVLEALERAGLTGRTLVVVTSDHGEEFGEFELFGHGLSLTEEVTHVPWIARLPAALESTPGQVFDEPVSLVDVAPWILSIAGVAPDPRMALAAPFGASSVRPPSREVSFLELDNHLLQESAVLAPPYKLVRETGRSGAALEQPLEQLFDLSSPGGEHRDLALERPAERARLRALLEEFHRRATAAADAVGSSSGPGELDPELRRNLEALGYLQGEDE